MGQNRVDGAVAGLRDGAAVSRQLADPDGDAAWGLVALRHLVGEHERRRARTAFIPGLLGGTVEIKFELRRPGDAYLAAETSQSPRWSLQFRRCRHFQGLR